MNEPLKEGRDGDQQIGKALGWHIETVQQAPYVTLYYLVSPDGLRVTMGLLNEAQCWEYLPRFQEDANAALRLVKDLYFQFSYDPLVGSACYLGASTREVERTVMQAATTVAMAMLDGGQVASEVAQQYFADTPARAICQSWWNRHPQ